MDTEEYTPKEKLELLGLARQTIENYLRQRKRDYPESTNPKFSQKRGVFVTLHRQGELRGCIGYPLPIKPLFQAVVDNAVASATEDPRFPAVTADELEEIDIEISVLTVPAEVGGVEDVRVGRDGIIISDGLNRGLLLPQVPVEQQWDLEEYISYGCLKAGLPRDAWRGGVKIETFQAIVFGEEEMKAS
jgi:AmmeMemoRadiSam system protein A